MSETEVLLRFCESSDCEGTARTFWIAVLGLGGFLLAPDCANQHGQASSCRCRSRGRRCHRVSTYHEVHPFILHQAGAWCVTGRRVNGSSHWRVPHTCGHPPAIRRSLFGESGPQHSLTSKAKASSTCASLHKLVAGVLGSYRSPVYINYTGFGV